MTKKEFMKMWIKKREAALREMYKDDPHGAACLVASLVGMKDEGEKLWRKQRKALRNEPIEKFEIELGL